MYDDDFGYEPRRKPKRRKAKKEAANPVGMLVTAGAIGVVLYRVIQRRWPWEKASISTLTQHTLGRKIIQVSKVRSLIHGGGS